MKDPIGTGRRRWTVMNDFQSSLATAGGDAIERVDMDCVLAAGDGLAPLRQVGLKTGHPLSAQATTMNNMYRPGVSSISATRWRIRTSPVAARKICASRIGTAVPRVDGAKTTAVAVNLA